jgi:hypothetical protein
VVAFALPLVLGIALHFSEVGAFVVRSEVDHNLLVVAGQFLLVLLHASLYYHVHEVVSVALGVDLRPCLELLELRVLEDLPSLL